MNTLTTTVRKFIGLNPYPIPKVKPFFLNRVKKKPTVPLETEKHEKEVVETPQVVEDDFLVWESFLEESTPPTSVKQQPTPQKIGDATLDQVFKYDFKFDQLVWKTRPLHWFLSERVAKGWNTLYAGYCINKHPNLAVSGRNIVYRLPKGYVEQCVKEKYLHPDQDKQCPTVKSIATDIVYRG